MAENLKLVLWLLKYVAYVYFIESICKRTCQTKQKKRIATVQANESEL